MMYQVKGCENTSFQVGWTYKKGIEKTSWCELRSYPAGAKVVREQQEG
jgi:hypothetical protein